MVHGGIGIPKKNFDPDLACHVTFTRARGICLFGKKSVLEIFPEVPIKDFVDSIYGDFTDAAHHRDVNPIYFVLNTCRVYIFLKSRKILSKKEGGEFFLNMDEISIEFREKIVANTLDGYSGKENVHEMEKTLLDKFAEAMGEIIAKELILQGFN